MNDKFVLRLVSSLVVASFAAISAAGAPSVPYRVQYPLPTLGMFDGMSVHTKPYNLTASDYPAIKAAGFSWVRAQMSWFAIEHVQGQYDFSTMDTFVQNAKASGLRVHFYLDGGNAFYTGNNGTYPTTTTQIAAFDNFAKAAVGHYQHQGIMWEMLNEPDLGMLTPAQYVALSHPTALAMRSVSPDEWIIGPGISSISLTNPMNYFTAVAQAGGLADFDAVTVHAYRSGSPETVGADFAAVRNIISQYVPNGFAMPLFAGEWGYASNTLPFIIPPSTFTTGTPNMVASSLSFTSNSTWKGYYLKPTQTAVADPMGGTQATRFASADYSSTNGCSGVVQPGPEVAGQYYTVSCWLKSEGAPMSVAMGIDDSSGTSFQIDGTWRRYSFTFKAVYKWNQNRIFQVFEWGIGNPAWDIYGPMVELIGTPTAAQVTSAQQSLQSEYYQRMYVASLGAGVPYTCMYQWKDTSDTPCYGIMNADGSATPVFSGVQSFFNLYK